MGRRRIDILIPRAAFTTRDLRNQNPDVSAFVIQRNLAEWVAGGKIRRVRPKAGTGRKKAFYVYEPVPAAKSKRL
jgi:hypothetical protein